MSILNFILALGIGAACPWLLAQETSGKHRLRVANFNAGLAHGAVPYAAERRPEIIRHLNRLDVDILCLNEVWEDEDQRLFIEQLRSNFPHAWQERSTSRFYHYAQGSNGLLLLSKSPMVQKEIRRFDSFFIQRAALVASIELGQGQKIRVACTHLSTDLPYLPYWGSFKNWDAELMAQIQTMVAWKDVDVLIGDLNAGPQLSERILTFKPEAYAQLKQSGLVSPYAEARDAACTWCAENQLAGGKEDYIIDHILFYQPTNVHSVQRILYDDVLIAGKQMKLSDHAGIAVVFDFGR